MPSFPLLRLMLLLAAAGGAVRPVSCRAGEQVFAGAEQGDRAAALAVDDAGRVYLSVTRAGSLSGTEPPVKDGVRPPEAATGAGEMAVCLTDTGGDGQADHRVVLAGGFNAPPDGPAGGIWPLPGGGVLFGCSPALWRLEDDNGDLRADRRLPLFQGLGIRPGTGVPGCRAVTGGPDGRIYFTVSARGFRVTSREGERFVREAGGAVFSSRPDGSGLECLAVGLCDPAGIVVDGRGRVFVADAAPDGLSSRVLYVLPGSDFGWDALAAPRGLFTGGAPVPGLTPAAGVIPVRATGLAMLPPADGTPDFPRLVVADGRPGGGLLEVTLAAEGGGVKAAAGPVLWRGGSAWGVAVDPGGALLWADWGAGMAPGTVPRLCRLALPDAPAWWPRGAALLRDGLSGVSSLEPLLEHGHPRVRERAQEALAARGFLEALEPLSRVARRAAAPEARWNAVWGLARLARTGPPLLNEISLLFGAGDPGIRALALHIAGESGYDGPPRAIVQRLRDPVPEVRVAAALAAGRLCLREAAGPLLAAAGEAGRDPWLVHALAWALSRTLSEEDLGARGLEADAPAPLRAVVVQALRMRRSAVLADFVPDPGTGAVAAAAIYDGLIFPGYPALAAWLDLAAARPEDAEEGRVRRALAAALHLGTPEAADAAGRFALSLPDASHPLRAAALEALRAWDVPPGREAVYGRREDPLPRPPGLARGWLAKLDPSAVPPADPAALRARIADGGGPEAARVDALQQLAAVQPAMALETIRSLLPGTAPSPLRAAARGLSLKLDPPGSYGQIAAALAGGDPGEMQTVLQAAGHFDSPLSEVLWQDLGKRFVDGTLDPAVRLEVLEGLVQRDTATRSKYRRMLETADAALSEETDPLARWRLCETGGDPAKGRLLYETGRLVCCTGCHALQGRGGTSGPELDGAGRRLTRGQLLAALVQPSAEITPGYGLVTVHTAEEGTLSGLLRRRDDTGVLLLTETGPRELPAPGPVSPAVSPMPPAGALLTFREIRDLVAWLATLE